MATFKNHSTFMVRVVKAPLNFEAEFVRDRERPRSVARRTRPNFCQTEQSLESLSAEDGRSTKRAFKEWGIGYKAGPRRGHRIGEANVAHPTIGGAIPCAS